MKKKQAAKELDKVIVDLEELTAITFLPHQIDKLKKISEELKDGGSTEVHGGGTGND